MAINKPQNIQMPYLTTYDLTTPYAQIGKTGPAYSVSSPYTPSSNYLLNVDTVSGLPQPKTRLASDYLGFGSQIAPGFQPTIDQGSLAKGVKDQNIINEAAKSSKNQKLALMLYALGGALKGDKDFVQNTLALQQMQEGKKKQEAQKKKYQDFLAKLPDGSFKDLATALGPDKLDDLLLERYKAETKEPKERKMVQGGDGYYYYVDTGERVLPGVVKPPKEKTISDYVADIAKKVQEDPNYELSDQDKRILGISRKASESAMMLEELQAQALKDYNIGGNESLPVFSTKEQAQAAGLKSGDRFKDPSGNIYTVK